MLSVVSIDNGVFECCALCWGHTTTATKTQGAPHTHTHTHTNQHTHLHTHIYLYIVTQSLMILYYFVLDKYSVDIC